MIGDKLKKALRGLSVLKQVAKMDFRSPLRLQKSEHKYKDMRQGNNFLMSILHLFSVKEMKNVSTFSRPKPAYSDLK